MMLAMCAALSFVLAADPTPAPILVLKAAAVHVGDGTIHRPGWIAIGNGKIVAVGAAASDADLKARFQDAEIKDLGAREILPGLVDGVGYAGLLRGTGENEESDEITPTAKVAEVIYADHPTLRQHLMTGVTSMVIQPGTRNVIGGFAAHVKTFGLTREEIIVDDHVALRITLGMEPAAGNRAGRGGQPSMWTRRPTSRMSTVFLIRREFDRARTYADRKAKDPRTPHDAGLEVVLRALRGEVAVHWHAREAKELDTAVRLAKEYQIPRNVFLEAHEIDTVAKDVQALGAKVLMGPLYHPQYRAGSGSRFGMAFAQTDGTLWPVRDPTPAEARFLVHISEHSGDGSCTTCVVGMPCAVDCNSCAFLVGGVVCLPCKSGAPCADHPNGSPLVTGLSMPMPGDGFAIDAFAGQGRFGVDAGKDYDADKEALSSCVACCGLAFSPMMPDENGWARLAIREVLDLGVDGAFARGGSSEGDTLLDFARIAVRVGVAPEKALQMVTHDPARILGIDGRVGRLAEGLDADLLVTSGDPLAATSALEIIVVGGKVAEDKTGLIGTEQE